MERPQKIVTRHADDLGETHDYSCGCRVTWRGRGNTHMRHRLCDVHGRIPSGVEEIEVEFSDEEVT